MRRQGRDRQLRLCGVESQSLSWCLDLVEQIEDRVAQLEGLVNFAGEVLGENVIAFVAGDDIGRAVSVDEVVPIAAESGI